MAANPIPPAQKPGKPVQVNLYEAKTHLSSLVDRAAKGEEFVIAKAGKPMARLSPVPVEEAAPKPLRKFGQNLLGITYIADDFDAPLPEERAPRLRDVADENPARYTRVSLVGL